MMDDEEVQDLWKTKMKFDVAVVEQFNGDCALGLAYILNTPVIALTSHLLMPYHYDRYGISYNPSYIPFLLLEGSTESTLMQRLAHTISHIYMKFIYQYLTQRYEYKIISKYVNNMPPLEELGRNIKFLLLYNNMMLTGSNILPANVIEVGGYHVAKPQPLRDDLLKFIEESEHGVIYISFGSMLRTASIPKDKMQAILTALAELPQRVVWKWEAKSLPGKPKNIFVSKWLPQNDLLAHPNVTAFYSHCGMLGTTEALYHGVPLVGMPMFADQFRNAAAVEESGFGVTIKLENLTKDNLLKKFKTVLDPMFQANVKLLSKAWHDRPKSAMDTAIHWTEFAAKYPTLTFRSPAADVPLYQYLCLDIIFILSIIPITVICVVAIIYKTYFKSKSKQKSIKKKDKNM
ncbi:UDP-glucuronosyltransferase 2B15 [Papilio machaon]|uniref:UDP-glucuronosyltransferase 2B15 n=1 Tax=Papilio machaon TaxID=76193 RepID=A0A194RRL0_PAPMA|nr:UDP-glucuronosyltransferase 2B15 [Papilio machaon]